MNEKIMLKKKQKNAKPYKKGNVNSKILIIKKLELV